jgi:2-polyprenyl-6-methoxyphenol hydroxylase-like FAD-dependent oxidoreductase
MQFHLNGFRTGDPNIAEPAQRNANPDRIPDEVDVLIVGCGPAGLTLASQLAAFPAIKTVIIDQKPGPLLLGQADGVACRTMEMFEAFGFSERVLKESYWVNETCFWKPDEKQRERIIRSGRIQDVEDGLSEFPHVILNQARVHDFYLDVMRHAPARLEPFYARKLIELDIAAAGSANEASHRVTVRLERIDPGHNGEVETVRARYVVGCDGARSVVRRSLGRALHGDSANQAWGVMDVLAVTDFPDIRLKAVIHSANEGSLLVIPREGGYLARLYIELDKLNENERVTERNITIDRLIAAAQRILRPYTLEVKEVAWWSFYDIGQRLCDKFDDVPEAETASRLPCVFIAGDACHTHSPKAGQGMNVSMQDGFNLGAARAVLAAGVAQLLGRAADDRQGVDRLRPRVRADVQRAAQGCGSSRWCRSGGVPAIFRPARTLHRGNGDPVQALADQRRTGLAAPGEGSGGRDALPLSAGHSPGRCQAASSRPHGQRGRALAALSLRRQR